MSHQTESRLLGNSLVSFGESVSADLRADVMDCLLYAQLSADGKYHRARQWRQWIEQYQRVIYQKGSRISGAINPIRLEIRGVRDLQRVPAQLAGQATSPELRQLLARSIQTLMDSDHANAYFHSWFTAGRTESMQVIPCTMNELGGVNILVCGLQMTTQAVAHGGFIWEFFSGLMTVRGNGASFLMTEEGYAPHRASIARYLASQAQQAIIEL